MGEFLSQAVANSILECLPETIKTEAYVESIGRYSLLLQRDGEGQVPLMNIFADYTLLLYGRDKSQELEDAIRKGLEVIGYKIKFSPVNLGSSFLYLIEKVD